MSPMRWYQLGDHITGGGGGVACAMAPGTNNQVEYQATIKGLNLL
jgi:ribonuclease HI